MPDGILNEIHGLGSGVSFDGQEGSNYPRAITEALLSPGKSPEEMLYRGQIEPELVPILGRIMARDDFSRAQAARAEELEARRTGQATTSFDSYDPGHRMVARQLALTASVEGRAREQASQALVGQSIRDQKQNKLKDKLWGKSNGDGE